MNFSKEEYRIEKQILLVEMLWFSSSIYNTSSIQILPIKLDFFNCELHIFLFAQVSENYS